MAGKGPIDVVVDAPSLSEIIVFVNRSRFTITDEADSIRAICKQMSDNKSLSGGDGEEIKNNFKIIADGCQNLVKSFDHISAVLNERLSVLTQMNKGKITAESTEEAKKAAKKMGVLKKE